MRKGNASTKEVTKNTLSSNNNKTTQSTNSIEAYVYRTSNKIKEITKCSKFKKKIIKFDDVRKENIKDHNPNWL